MELMKPIIEKAEKYIPITENMLPCKNTCPYGKDAMLRYTDLDPGAPCPKFALLANMPLTDDQIIQCGEQITRERRPPFWNSILEHLK